VTDTPTWPATCRMAAGPSVPAPAALSDALAAGTRLGEFEIVEVLGAGGFGIVYLALDHVLLRRVAIKEYMPRTLAERRGAAPTVSLRTAADAATFEKGLDSFFNEARLLASFDHPSLVKVHRFWKANGTAYMAMQHYPGRTLKAMRDDMKVAPDGAWLRAFVEALLGALEVLHADGVYHRDISPDNILLLPDGRPVLLDFGSARRALDDRTQSMTALLKPNFSPLEQYADEPGMRQGPWTDLYALGATVHYLLTGQAPVPSVLRVLRDGLAPLCSVEAAFPGVPAPFLATIDWTLALAPSKRPQSVGTVRRALNGELVPPALSGLEATVPYVSRARSDVGDRQAGPTETSGKTSPLPSPPSVETRPFMRRRTRRSLALVTLLVGTSVGGWATWGRPSSTTEPQAGASLLSRATAAVPVRPTASPPPVAPARLQPIAEPSPETAAPKARQRASGTALRQKRPEPPLDKPPATSPGPAQICSGHNFFSRAVCMTRECQAPKFLEHPECRDARRVAEGRLHRMEQQ
jgi:serine/threonine protein kinase